jgi:hypothetical protein
MIDRFSIRYSIVHKADLPVGNVHLIAFSTMKFQAPF